MKGIVRGLKGRLVIEKGGPGSGHRGHAGRPGQRGGSAAGIGYSRVSYTGEVHVSALRRELVNNSFQRLPQRVRDTVDELVVHGQIEGYTFEAGGTQFQAAGSWESDKRRISVYSNAKDAEITRVVEHEVGHAVFDDWQRQAEAQAAELHSKPVVRGNAAFTMLGEVNRNYPGINPENYRAYEAKSRWDQARFGVEPEDGVTKYSSAWNNDTETFAEMYRLYRTKYTTLSRSASVWSPSESAIEAVREHCVNAGAPTLGEVFGEVIRDYED